GGAWARAACGAARAALGQLDVAVVDVERAAADAGDGLTAARVAAVRAAALARIDRAEAHRILDDAGPEGAVAVGGDDALAALRAALDGAPFAVEATGPARDVRTLIRRILA
ncbi:MAG: hypothetical protein ABMB14_32020, partial [Myxococcota bacterium]